MLNIAGYQRTNLLYSGIRTQVYQAIRTTDQKPVIIKVLRNPHPTFNELVQFRNQYIITRHLNSPYIVQPLALERYGKGYTLIMPDEGAIALQDYWQTQTHSLQEFLGITIQLAEALHDLNQQRIIHKDIKPQNILIHPQTHHIQLIDFSISSLLPKEQQQLINPNILEGTLAYISPEQTGRMNRGIDYRTDFYSLGVTLFELLTGQLPFETTDSIELVHCHLAKMPRKLELSDRLQVRGEQQEIPQVFSDIVMKLIAKNAEDRYQSALGLKFDLEQCLQQLETTGKITPFELGKQDRCDRFIIPEKLYGRETEVQTLLDAFERVAILSKGGGLEMMLVAGFSGIGKTAVINEVHKPIIRQRGYFIKGKYDQFNRNIPLSAFVQAFRDLIGQLLGESDTNLDNWKTKILNAVGDNGQVIIDVIPELEQIIGKQSPVLELSGSAAQNRFNLVFSKFVNVFTTKEHPLILFLDDLQWADSASLNLLKLLMTESEVGYLLILGAYRDNEVSPAHPLMLTLGEIQKQNAIVHTLTLNPLKEADITQLVADTLLCSVEFAESLSRLVYQKTGGNPFFTTQFLQGLHEENCITFNSEERCWQCDLTQVRLLSLTDDVVEFMVRRLRKLPEATQNVLRLAACIGNYFNLETLAVICEETQEEVATDLWNALQEGFVIPQNETYKFFQGNEDVEREKEVDNISVSYRFLHDRVQQAAYALILEQQKQETHLKIGYLLQENTSAEQLENQIFDIVSQFNMSLDLLRETTEKYNVILLNLKAGQKAKIANAYSASLNFFKTAINLLEADAWDTDYQLALSLYEQGANVAYLCGQYEESEQWVNLVLENAKELLDKINIFETKILSLIAQNKLFQAIKIGVSILENFDTFLPIHPEKQQIFAELEQVKTAIDCRVIQDFLNLPVMTDANTLAIIRLLLTITPPSYNSNPGLLPIISATMIQLCLEFGNSIYAAPAYCQYGAILASSQDIESGYAFGKLSLQVLEKFNAKRFAANVTVFFEACIRHWKEPLKATLEPLRKTVIEGLEVGDIEFAGYAAMHYCSFKFVAGENLEILDQTFVENIDFLRGIHQGYPVEYLMIWRQLVVNLLSCAENVTRLIGEYFDEDRQLSGLIEKGDKQSSCCIYLAKTLLTYLFGEYTQSVQAIDLAEQNLDGITGLPHLVTHNFYSSLTRLAHYPQVNPKKQNTYLEKVYANQEDLKKWSQFAPWNCQHKYDLVAAELFKISGEKLEAMEFYDRAIAGAKENGYLQEEAIANELAAKFYLDWNKEKLAAPYLQEAYYCYARWGSKAKIDQLEIMYSRLLTPILQRSQPPQNSNLSQTSSQTFGTFSTTISTLDLASIIKAYRTISEEMTLDNLLSKLMKILLENAGADQAIFILNNDNTQELVAQCIDEQCNLSNSPFPDTDTFPQNIVNRVKRTKETVLINQLEQDKTFTIDPYFLQSKPKSLLCTPILNQGKLIGILYLENHLTTDAFTPERLEIINLLMAQAAISIENARLYHHLERYSQNLEDQVQQRTQQLQDKNQHLQDTLEQLKQAQTKLIQTEKMSSLGKMVAGIAHEINNPIAFIKGNIYHARTYFYDLLELLNLYQENSPDPDQEIQDKIEEIDLKFLSEDLKKLLDSIQRGSDRVSQIVLSLRNFSRLDENGLKRVDLHEGLDNTLLILQHRLIPNASSPEISISKNYGEIPLVNCFANQLNQVFLQILANAIDALMVLEVGSSPEICITTEMKNASTVSVKIADNGMGMTEDIQHRIFDPFFTTKPIGQGTGLGLSISYQIITEQHQGELRCISQVGQGTEFIIDLPI